VHVGDALEAEAVVDALLGSLADDVQIGEHAPRVLDLTERQVGGATRVAVDELVERQALAAELAILAALPIDDELRARKAVIAEIEEAVDLALDLDLALHFIDLEEEPPLRRVESIVRVDGAGGDAGRGLQLAESIVLSKLR